VSSYQFLSPEWIDAAKRIRDEYEDRLPAAVVEIRANVVVTEAPFGDGSVIAYIDTSAGALMLDLGALDDAELTVRIDYATARRIFVGRDQSAAMEAFITGRLVVEGDFSKLLALQGQAIDPVAEEIATRLDELTIT
jgi:hypothetical protein